MESPGYFDKCFDPLAVGWADAVRDHQIRPGSARGLLESAKLRKFTLKIGGQELTMEELTDQQSKLLSDLQSQIEALRNQMPPQKVGVVE